METVDKKSGFWGTLDRGARIGLIVGTLLIIGVTILLGIHFTRTNYQPLFTSLSPADAAVITAELDKQKVPYRLDQSGEVVLVPDDIVHKTRLKLMGKELPLHGTVGFELFNTTDFGMTEFAQKVNFQRALQGELTRTILSLEEIQAARVHLALPEQGIFKKGLIKPKASITLTMKSGRQLRPEQVSGIQRLISAAVPEVVAQEVVITDQRGITLSKGSIVGASILDSDGRLEVKKAVEDYLAKKIINVLDGALGPQSVVASVDAVIDFDEVNTRIEDILAGAFSLKRRKCCRSCGSRESDSERFGLRRAKSGKSKCNFDHRS